LKCPTFLREETPHYIDILIECGLPGYDNLSESFDAVRGSPQID